MSGLKNVPIQAEDWIKIYNDRRISGDVEFALRTTLKNAILTPYLNIQDRKDNSRVAQLVFDRRLPGNRQVSLEQIDFRKGQYQELAFNQMEKDPPNPEKSIKIVKEFDEDVQRIKAKGGKVILVAPPGTGVSRDLTEKMFPRKAYLDVLAANTSATPIHFMDYPGFDEIICPDGIHFDSDGTAKFTEELAKIIFGKQLFVALFKK